MVNETDYFQNLVSIKMLTARDDIDSKFVLKKLSLVTETDRQPC